MTVIAPALPVGVSHIVLPGTLARRADARPGESVACFLKRHKWRFDLDTILVIDGKPVLRRGSGWRRTIIRPGADVRFISRPFGGQSGKQLAGLAALIALTVFAPHITGPMLASIYGSAAMVPTWASGLANALVVAGGMMLFNTLVYPRSGNKGDEDNLYSFNASGNVARPLETIPDAYGRLQRDLDYAAIPYKTFEGNDEYFHGLFMVGCGRYSHEALLIEDNPFWTAAAAAADGTGSGSAGAVPGVGWADNATASRPNSPGVLEPWQGIQVEFVEPGQPVTLFPTNIHQSPEVSGLEFDHPAPGNPTEGWSPWFNTCNPGATTRLVHLDMAFPSGFVRNGHETLANYEVRFRPVNDAGAPVGDVQLFSRQIIAFQKRPWRRTDTFQLSPARWQISFRRTEAPLDPSLGSTDMYAAGVRAELPGSTVFEHGTMVAVRIKATKQLSDYSQRRIRYRGTRILPVWTSEGFEEQPTRNPIWAGLNLRTHPVYGGKLPLARVLLEDLIEEAAKADARGDTFDHEFRNAVGIPEAVDTAFGVARCKHRWLGHTFSIVRDEWRETARMLITDREIVAGSFSLNSTFRPASAPDGLILNYVDEQTWQKAQVVVPLGSNPSNPVIEEGRGITNRAHATREAVFKWNAQVKRRVAPSFTMMTDGHILAYGDHADLSSQSPQGWGEAFGVVGLSGNTVRLPRPATWADATMYAVVRTALGRTFGPCRVTQGASARHLVFNSDDLAALLSGTGMTLADALARQADADPPTLALGRAFDFLRRAVITSAEPAGEKMLIAGFLDYAEVHEPDPVTEAPRPPPIEFPARRLPRIAGLDAGLVQELFETRLRASWLPSTTALRYVAEISYDAGLNWITVYDGPVAGFDVVVDNADLLLRVTPHGERGAGYTSDAYAIAAIAVIKVPPASVGLDAFDEAVQERIQDIEQAAQDAFNEAGEVRTEALAAAAEALAEARAALRDVQDVVASLSGDLTRANEAGSRIGVTISQRISSLSQALASAMAVSEDMRGALGDLGWERRGPGGASRFRAVDTINNGLTALSTTVELLAGKVDIIVAASGEGLEQLDAELSIIRQTLDALQGLYEALVTTVNSNSGSVSQLLFRMNAVEGAITLLASQASLNEIEERLEAAELQLSSGTVTIETIAALRQSQQVASHTLADLLARFQALSDAQWEQAAATRFRLDSRIDANGQSIATLQIDLAALTASSAATFSSLTQSIADATSALTAQINLLQAQVNNPGTGLAATRAQIQTAAVAQADTNAALASLISALEAVVYTGPNNNSALSAAITAANTARASGDDALAASISSLTATVNTKTRTFVAGSAPTATATGDIWFHTGENNRQYRWNGSAWVALPDNNKNATTAAGSAPSSPATGDLWIDTSANNRVKRWNGSTWVDYTDTRLTQAMADITSEAAARASADSALATRATALEATVFDSATDSNAALKSRIATEETTRAAADTTLSNRATTLESLVNHGTDGNLALKARIAAEETTRASADSAISGTVTSLTAVVDTKSRTFVAGSAPTATATGDVWFHTGEGNRQYVWSGSAWVARPDGNKNKNTVAGSAPSSPTVGDIWIDTSANNRVKVWSGSAWTDYTDTRLTTAQADITTLQSTKVDAAGATALAQTEVNAALGDVTANGLFKVAAATTPSGATSAAKLLVKAADSGNYADAGIEMVAIAGGGGSPQGYLVLVGNRIYRRPSGGGAPILMVDSEGRFVGPSLTPGATIQVLPYDRDVSTGYVNVGVGSTTGGGSNSWREEKIGDMSLIANTAAVIGGAGSILPILTTMEMAVDMTINYSFGSVLAQPILGVRLIARPVGGGSDIIIMDRVAPPSNVSYGGGANNWLWRWGSNEHDPKVSNSVRALPAGDYEIYLAWRWSYTPVSWSESAYTVRLSGNFSVLALIR